MRYLVYRLINFAVPEKVRAWVADSPLTRPIRDLLIRAEGDSRVAQGVVEWHGLSFILNAPYRQLYRAQTKGIENGICRFAHHELKPGDTAVDVGANCGFITMIMAKRVAPSGRVVTFEIGPKLAATLRKTVADNQLDDVVEVVAQGASSRVEGGFTTVDAAVLPLVRGRVRFIKIDVDGGDFQVLQGAIETLKAHHPMIIIEMGESQQQIFDLLKSLGYAHFSDQGGRSWEPPHWPLNLVASVDHITPP